MKDGEEMSGEREWPAASSLSPSCSPHKPAPTHHAKTTSGWGKVLGVKETDLSLHLSGASLQAAKDDCRAHCELIDGCYRLSNIILILTNNRSSHPSNMSQVDSVNGVRWLSG